MENLVMWEKPFLFSSYIESLRCQREYLQIEIDDIHNKTSTIAPNNMDKMMAFQNIVLGSINRKENKGLPGELEKLFIILQILKFRKSCEMTEKT